MSLAEELEALNEGHANGQVPDDVVASWLVLQTTSQVADNLARLAMGREILAQKVAAGHGGKQEVLDAWAALTGRSPSLMDQFALTAKRVMAAIEEAGDAGQELERSVLHCRYEDLVTVVREALDLPELKTRKGSSRTKTDQERVDAWVELAKSFFRDGVSADALMAGARALLAWLAAQLAGAAVEHGGADAPEVEATPDLSERSVPERIEAAVEEVSERPVEDATPRPERRVAEWTETAVAGGSGRPVEAATRRREGGRGRRQNRPARDEAE